MWARDVYNNRSTKKEVFLEEEKILEKLMEKLGYLALSWEEMNSMTRNVRR
jgi:hypothetical protein